MQHSSLHTALTKKQSSSITKPDLRGLNSPGHKTPVHKVEVVRKHILSFPALPSHYARHDTSKVYLEQSLNITRMYELYVNECKGRDEEPVKENMYRLIFRRDFNIAFHQPKKDSCLMCDKYKNGSVSQEEYDAHMMSKQKAREHKELDKEQAKKNPNIHTCTFDLQQVLSCPNTTTSTVYYKRKLSVFNLSVYSLGTGLGCCYMWDETEGRRGASEIGTAMHMYISSLPILFLTSICTPIVVVVRTKIVILQQL